MGKSFIENHIEYQWATLRKSAQASATQLAKNCCETAAAMMHAAADKFCSMSAPAAREDLNSAYTQRMALSTLLTAIARADAMAQAHPDVMDRIFQKIKDFCQEDLAHDGESFIELQRRNLELTTSIAEICYEHAATRMNRGA